jgi:hypothetical protein
LFTPGIKRHHQTVTTADYLASLALVVSTVSFVLARGSDRRSRLPVLVVVYDPARGWLLRNVGNGPALNVIVAQHNDQQGWFAPVRVPPIARDAELSLAYLGHWDEGRIGAIYEDFLGADRRGRGRAFTVTCGRDINRVRPGRKLGKVHELTSTALWEVVSR